ncbi:MAG: ATP-dependent 6-phosphofructokinase [Candidatus Omnitrophica bacterium]|nr:ATP-dependent 6-phosphofructokinase [Candidatus Omnitrophota bacterium]
MKIKYNIVPVETLGQARYPSPLIGTDYISFIDDADGSINQTLFSEISTSAQGQGVEFFELAGPRESIYFDPEKIACGIVTCGGLCPGLNDVIRSIVNSLWFDYGVKTIYGFRYGYKGLTKSSEFPPLKLDLEVVDEIHTKGGTILSSSRGNQDIAEMVQTLQDYGIKILFTIGGDGTLRGAQALAQYIKDNNLDISIVAVPKTIDNDINYIQLSFGFQTAVEAAYRIIESAHIEAKGAPNGVGLIKLMGRHSGSIACHATLSDINVNYCLIPEVGFRLEGSGGLLAVLKKRLKEKQHAVIVVAEGAGQDLIGGELGVDLSGNIRLKDIGLYLKEAITSYFENEKIEVNVKYFDPSYSLRSVAANAFDSAYCLFLGRHAVHAAISGRTNVLVGFANDKYIHVPIAMAVGTCKQVNRHGDLWHMVTGATQQPNSIFL